MLNTKIFYSNNSLYDYGNSNENKYFLKTALAWNGSVTPKVIPRLVAVGFYSLFVVWISQIFPHFQISITPFEYSGAVLGLLLVLRVNAGMDRWWEARKIWGSIVNQSRNLAIIGQNYSSSDSSFRKHFLAWVSLWPHSMREHLREEKSLEEGIELVGEENQKKVVLEDHMPMYIGSKIAYLLNYMRKNGLDDFSFHQAEKERSRLIDAIGACERIKGTPIPLVVAIKVRRFIFLFLSLLPLALVAKTGWLTPLIVILTAYPLFSLDEIGLELQSPFSRNSLSHLPLGLICKNIEKNISSLVRFNLKEEMNLDSYKEESQVLEK